MCLHLCYMLNLEFKTTTSATTDWPALTAETIRVNCTSERPFQMIFHSST
uniref:Uncharacterized protein n=1 Tax=Anguilla anguilla TaxID=7936 RepID=A0A0E9PCD1_ANGAN